MTDDDQLGAVAPPAPDSGPIRSGRAATLVSAGILLSRLSGLFRIQLTAAALGRGIVADAFLAAFRIPNLLQNLLGEGVLSASFIPVYAKALEEDDDERGADRVAGAIGGLLGLVAAVTVAAGALGARPIAAVLVGGFSDETFELTVDLTRIMIIGSGMLVMSAWCLGILNSHRRFFLSYVAPVVWNLTQISALVLVGLLGWSPWSTAEALAWAVAVGGALQFLVQLPSVLAVTGHLRLTLDHRYPGVREVLRRFGPAVLGRGVVQIAAYLDLFLASFLFPGAVAALGYSQILYLLPVSLFAMSVAAAELPELSRAPDDVDQMRTRVQTGLERVGFFVAFVTAAYLGAGRTIVAALFEHGEFGPSDTTVVALVLGAYALGLLAISASRLVQSALYAQGDVSGPARIAAVRVAVAAGLGVVLMLVLNKVVVTPAGALTPDPLPDGTVESLADAGWGTLGAVGLALGSAVGAWLEFGLLRRRLRRRVGDIRLWRSVARSLPAAAVALGVMAVIGEVAEGLPVLALAPLVLVTGGLTYAAVATFHGPPVARDLVTSVLGRR